MGNRKESNIIWFKVLFRDQGSHLLDRAPFYEHCLSSKLLGPEQGGQPVFQARVRGVGLSSRPHSWEDYECVISHLWEWRR